MWSIVPAAGRDELYTHTRTENAPCHEYVVHGDDVELIHALRLELAVLQNVSGCLRVAGGHECPWYANLSIASVYL